MTNEELKGTIMTIDEFCKEVKRQMAERGIPEDTQIDYIDTDFMFGIKVSMRESGPLFIL